VAKVSVLRWKPTGGYELAAVIEVALILYLYFTFLIMKLVSESIFGTSAFLIIFNSAVECLKSTNWYSVDLDKHSQFQTFYSALRTAMSLT
jgi:hypothetical protein